MLGEMVMTSAKPSTPRLKKRRTSHRLLHVDIAPVEVRLPLKT
jgi:hypothetical protein